MEFRPELEEAHQTLPRSGSLSPLSIDEIPSARGRELAYKLTKLLASNPREESAAKVCSSMTASPVCPAVATVLNDYHLSLLNRNG